MTQMYTLPKDEKPNIEQQYFDDPSEPVELDDIKVRELLEDWAKQTLIVQAAQLQLTYIESVLSVAFGDRKRGIFSENAVVTREKGSRSFDWQQAAMIAGIPSERYKIYARPPSIDWRKMCLDEGVDQEDVPFTRKPDKIKIKMATLEE